MSEEAPVCNQSNDLPKVVTPHNDSLPNALETRLHNTKVESISHLLR